jgi:hypothetical protein
VEPAGGGSTDLDIPACARDALTFVYFARRELGQGRVPPPERVFFGGSYSARLEYTGPVTLEPRGKPTVTDRVAVSVKGAQANVSFEVFFARDAARTPLSLKVPFPVGTISMDLVR